MCANKLVLFEFHSSFFYVNDSHTNKILLKGLTKNEMYVFSLPSLPPQAYVGEIVSLS